MPLPPKTKYQLWQEGIDRAPGDSAWSVYDEDLKIYVGEVNQHLQSTPGFRPLDWVIIKAMIWTETGAASPQWLKKPMQIGVTGDPGLAALLGGKEGGELILPPNWAKFITKATAATQTNHNLGAGIAYLMMRAATFEWCDVVTPPDAPIREVIAKPGDSFAKIAAREGSTEAEVTSLNSFPATKLKPGQVVRVRSAKRTKLITGWRTIDAQMIAARYNGGGDPRYADKINYCLSLIRGSR